MENLNKFLLSQDIPGIYKACCYMEKGLCFDNIDLRDCCIGIDGNKRGMPVIEPNYQGEVLDWEKVFEHKEKRNSEVQEGKIPAVCEGCGFLNENEFFTGKRLLSEVIYQTNNFCNARCIYCSPKANRGVEFYSAYKATQDLLSKGYFKKGGRVFFNGGEPTLMRDFDKIVELYLNEDADITVNSSGINYRDSIYKGIEQNKLTLLVSIDCGTKKLYQTIKQVDKFDELVENLKKYSEALNEDNQDRLRLKYIIIPGINDSVRDIKDFFKLAKKLKIKTVVFDMECMYAGACDYKLPPYIYKLADYAEYSAEKNKMTLSYNVFFQWSNEKRKTKKVSFKKFEESEFAEKIEEEKIKNLSKNRYYAGLPNNFSKVSIKKKK